MGNSKIRHRLLNPSPDRRKLLNSLLSQGEDTGPIIPSRIVPRPPGHPSPLSFNEERLWAMSRLQPDGLSANLHAAVRIRQPLELEVLHMALDAVVGRQQALRTTFAENAIGVTRMIAEEPKVSVPCEDLSGLDSVARASEIEAILEGHAEEPLDPTRGPLARFLLLRLEDSDYVFSVSMHAIISDGPSLRILLNEVFATYEALRRGTTALLSPLPFQYADFAAWQESSDRASAFEQHLSYWRQKLGNGVKELRLARRTLAERPQSVAQWFEGATRTIAISAQRHKSLVTFCQDRDVTLFMVLLAVFSETLSGWSGQTDFLVGIPASHRGQAGTESLIGPFGNILPLRADLSAGQSFDELLDRVRKTSVEAFAHRDLPYDRLLDEIPLPRLSAALLVPEALRPAGSGVTRLTPVPTRNRFALYDVQLSCFEIGERLIVSLHHHTSVLDEADADSMLSSIDRLLAASVKRPNRPLSLPWLSRKQSVEGRRNPIGHGAAVTESSNAEGRDHQNTTASDALENQLLSLWETVLGVTPIGIDDDFFELGGHSLVALRLFLLIEKVLGKSLPLSSLLEAPTVRQFAGLLRREGWSPRWTSLVAIQAAGRKPPFYCVHGAGGNVLFLGELARELGRDQPLYGFQALGLDGVSKPLGTVEEMAAHYVSELKAVQPQGPYYLGGYCFGAYAALEMARQLRDMGDSVAFLGAFNDVGGWRMVGSIQEDFDLHLSTLRRLDWRYRISYLRERISYRAIRLVSGVATTFLVGAKLLSRRTRGALPAALARLVVERSTHEAGMRYQPPRCAGTLTLFHSQTLALPAGGTVWHRIIDGTVETHEVQGDQTSMFTHPVVGDLAKQLSACLKQARTDQVNRS